MSTSITCPTCGTRWAGHSTRQAKLNRRLTPCPCELDASRADSSPSSVSTSHEVRWFGSGPVSRDLKDWFSQQHGPPLEEAERTDRYLLLPGCESVGIKMRGDRLEVKALCGSSVPLHLTNGLDAYQQRWIKWAIAAPSGSAEGSFPALAAARGAPTLFPCKKRRFSYKFDLSSGHVALQRKPGLLQAGASFELTEIDSPLGSHWTVALETFGVPPEDDGSLRSVAHQVLPTAAPADLLLAASMSYPEWLACAGEGNASQ